MFVLLTACAGPQATGTDCPPTGEPTLTPATADGEDSQPLEDGARLEVIAAPQGGYGLPLRAFVTGLVVTEGERPSAPMPVELTTTVDGDDPVSFLNTGATAYCQADGAGLIWNLVAPLDPERFQGADDLGPLHGSVATVHLRATDLEGAEATGEVQVQIEVPQ